MRLEPVLGVRNCMEVPASPGELEIAPRLLIGPNARCARWVVAVIVILVYGHNTGRNVNHVRAEMASLPNQPMVPPDAPDDERRHLRIQAAREEEKINAIRAALCARFECQQPQALGSSRLPQTDWLGDAGIPSPANHQKARMPGPDSLKGGEEIGEQENVAVDVAKKIVASERLGPVEQAVQTLGAELVAFDARLMAEAELRANLGRAGIVSEENHLNLWMKGAPARDGVSLDYSAVIAKRLGGREKGEHVAD